MISETSSKDLFEKLKELIDQVYSLLDVGCGLCLSLDKFECQVVIGIDVHRPYLTNRVNNSANIIPIHMDARDMSLYFLPKSISAVLFNDTLEHFNKNEGLYMLKRAEQIAVKRVIVFTPRGFFPQDDFDHFNLNGEMYQAHRSGWEPEEFVELGYQVLVFKDFHDARNASFRTAFGEGHPPVDALLAWKDL
ncbi:class I SAM-dependent methyltransferase [Paenibacillus sp. SI8]|uniref:class I SAM-dependent methyltransferase n=1 Tax=unclassified Paenibacillus TaxID=185978 RepID=UPI0034658DEF